MDKKLISFLLDSISIEDCRYTYSKMCLERISLHVANNTLYDKFNSLISDFIEDNELGDEWFENNFIDVEEVFEIVLDNYN